MSLSQILNSAKHEWSDWLAASDERSLNPDDMRRWLACKPPLWAFSKLAESIEMMQDEIDLQAMKIKELQSELNDASRQLIQRF